MSPSGWEMSSRQGTVFPSPLVWRAGPRAGVRATLGRGTCGGTTSSRQLKGLVKELVKGLVKGSAGHRRLVLASLRAAEFARFECSLNFTRFECSLCDVCSLKWRSKYQLWVNMTFCPIPFWSFRFRGFWNLQSYLGTTRIWNLQSYFTTT